MVAISFFSVNTTFAKNLRDILESESWMIKMKSSGNHSLAEFKDGFEYLDGDRGPSYSVQGNVLTLSSGQRSVPFYLHKAADGFTVKNIQGFTAFYLTKAPYGYAEFTKMRDEGDPEKRVALAKKLGERNLGPFVASQVAEILFDEKSYKSALTVYQKISDKKGVAACSIMQTAETGKVPAGVNIIASAKIFWEQNASTHPSLRDFYHRAEAIAYACAIAGNHGKAAEYQRALYQQAQRYQITKSSEMRKAGISVPKMGKVLLQYQNGKCPSNFKMSTI